MRAEQLLPPQLSELPTQLVKRSRATGVAYTAYLRALQGIPMCKIQFVFEFVFVRIG